ncbi:MAG: cyclic nucleotide-binding domain-containing protein [Rhizobiaceae bacterium]|nr:cyclic nucleotide-binding domain-containing protein [Rhizobiaceae bacterium]
MRPDDISEVRKLHLFEDMQDSNFQTMLNAAYLQTFPAQSELIREGDSADFLYVVMEGSIELFAKSNGRETTMAIVRPVNTFILAAVLKDAVYLMSARTVERSRVLMIPTDNVRTAFESDPDFARSIVTELAGCYRAVIKDHKNLKLRSAVERLANRLIKYHAEQGANGVVELFHDKRTLAALLGMTPENLSRAFNTLKPYGVEVKGNCIKLTDLAALDVLAKPNQLIDDRTV